MPPGRYVESGVVPLLIRFMMDLHVDLK